MKDAVNILCLYWVGEFRERDFRPIDVVRLHQSVSKWIDRPFNFYVLTNDMQADIPGTKIELLNPDDWPGWWSKMELYRPDLPKGRTLYLDLDSHVVGPLAPILDFKGDLVLFDDRTRQHEPKHIARGENGWVYRYQAATILFDAGAFVWLYEKFERDWDYYVVHYRSDQDILGEWIPNQPTFPRQWMIKTAELIKLHDRMKLFVKPKDLIISTGQPKRNLFRKLKEMQWFEEIAR